ncbi:MAG: hypothetical protein AB7K52_16070 [Phycisphaerales bacterium]
MYILNPDIVRFNGERWPGVASVTIERAAVRLIEDRGDNGPYPEFIDVPEQRVTARLVQTLHASDVPGPELGAFGVLEIWVSSGRSDAARVRLFADAVITGVRYDLAPLAAAGGRGSTPAPASRVITFQLASIDGKADPLATTLADTGPD